MVEALFLSHPVTSERVATAKRLAEDQDRSLRKPENLKEEPFRRATAHLREAAPAYAKMDEGRKALAKGETKEALRLLQEATRLAPKQALIWSFRAAAEAKAGQTETAYASAQKAVQLYPGLYRARFTAGVLAFELDKHRDSLAHLEAADQLVPGQPQITFFEGRNFEAQGRKEEAARAYHAVLQKVQQGEMAQYCYSRLVKWGYVRPAPAR
jgi:predicted Zn-dependent protease